MYTTWGFPGGCNGKSSFDAGEDAWDCCTGLTQKDSMGRAEGGALGLGIHLHPWRVHVDV